MRLCGKPLAGGPKLCLASFVDGANQSTYLKGVLWVGYDKYKRIVFTEGVRLSREGWVDYANFTPEAQKVWSATEALQKAGHALPTIV